MMLSRWTDRKGNVYIGDTSECAFARMMYVGGSEDPGWERAGEWVHAINHHDELVAALHGLLVVVGERMFDLEPDEHAPDAELAYRIGKDVLAKQED